MKDDKGELKGHREEKSREVRRNSEGHGVMKSRVRERFEKRGMLDFIKCCER